MTTESGRLFLQTAIQLDELRDADAERLLELLPEGQDPGRFAEKMGVLSASARLRVTTQLKAARPKRKRKKKKATKKTPSSNERTPSSSKTRAKRKTPGSGTTPVARRKPSSKGRVPARRSTARRTPRQSPLPAVALALVAGGVIAVGALVALKPAPEEVTEAAAPQPVETAAPAPAPSALPEPTPAPRATASEDAAAKRAAKRQADARALAAAETMVAKLIRKNRERTALTVLDELIADRGPIPGAKTARVALLRRCERLITEQGRRAERLVAAGDLEGALTLLSRLAVRLPREVQPRIDTLVKTLEARAAATAPKAVAKAEPTPAPTPAPAAPEPAPTKAPTPPTDDDDDEPEEPSRPAPPKLTGQPASELATKVQKRVSVRHTLGRDGTLGVNYPLQQNGELVDFKARGWDTFDVHSMTGLRDYQTSIMGLECGVGSQRLARMAHSIHFDGDFHVEVELWVSSASGRTLMVFMLGKRHGVSFGQQVVKVGRTGSLKRLTRRPADPSVFREERKVRLNFDCVDGTLTVRCNGRKTAVKRFTKGELKGPFGLLARDVRLQITHLKIKAKVDPTKL